MTFTYSSSSLTTDLAKVRSSIGDVIDRTQTNESLTDEEIQVCIDATASLELASVRACELLIARMRTKVDRAAANVTSSQRQKFDALLELLKTLKRRATLGSEITACAGGISQDRIDAAADDDDYPAPAFSVGMDDYS